MTLQKTNKNGLGWFIIPAGIVLFTIIVIATDKPQKNNLSEELGISPPTQKIKYEISTEKPNTYLSKNNLEILLSEKVDKHTLIQIANALRKDRMQYDRLWIFYYLPGMTVGNGAWAISHFTPEGVDMEILGASIKEDKIMGLNTVKTEAIIGKWKSNMPALMLTIFKKNGEIILKITFTDGSSMEKEVRSQKIAGRTRYDYVEPLHGEYLIVERNGNLGMYGSNGKFNEANKVK